MIHWYPRLKTHAISSPATEAQAGNATSPWKRPNNACRVALSPLGHGVWMIRNALPRSINIDGNLVNLTWNEQQNRQSKKLKEKAETTQGDLVSPNYLLPGAAYTRYALEVPERYRCKERARENHADEHWRSRKRSHSHIVCTTNPRGNECLLESLCRSYPSLSWTNYFMP